MLMNRFYLSGLAALVVSGSALADGFANDYWRLNLIHERSEDATFLDRSCDPGEGLAAYFGCVPGEGGLPIGARGDFGNSTGLELAWGRDMGSLWRGEFTIGYQPGFKYRGNANFLASGFNQPVSGSISQWRGGVNGYLDLMALVGQHNARFSPYLGAGVGVVRNRVATMTYEFPELSGQPALTTVPGGTTTNVAWSLALGMDFQLSDRNVLDIALSWNDYGDVRTGVGYIDVIRDGELLVQVPVGQTRANLETWGLQVGLRHYFRR